MRKANYSFNCSSFLSCSTNLSYRSSEFLHRLRRSSYRLRHLLDIPLVRASSLFSSSISSSRSLYNRLKSARCRLIFSSRCCIRSWSVIICFLVTPHPSQIDASRTEASIYTHVSKRCRLLFLFVVGSTRFSPCAFRMSYVPVITKLAFVGADIASSLPALLFSQSFGLFVTHLPLADTAKIFVQAVGRIAVTFSCSVVLHFHFATNLLLSVVPSQPSA